jgi:hypothetical protein
MATYDPNFSPLRDLKKQQAATEERKARLASREPPRSLTKAGSAFMRNGRPTSASTAREHTALSNWQAREDKRLSDVQSQLYQEEAAGRQGRTQAGIGAAGRLAERELQGSQQMGLAKFQAGQEMERLGVRGEQAQTLAGLKLPPADKRGLTQKQRADLETGFRGEYFGKGRQGKGLRKRYGTRTEGGILGIGGDEVPGGGVEAYVTEMMGRYSGQPQGAGLPSPAGQQVAGSGTVTAGVRQLSVSPGSDDITVGDASADQYVSKVKAGLPVAAEPDKAAPVRGRITDTALAEQRGGLPVRQQMTPEFFGGEPGSFEPTAIQQGVSALGAAQNRNVLPQLYKGGLGKLGAAKGALGRFTDPNYTGRKRRIRTIPYQY